MTILAYHGVGRDCRSSRIVCLERFREQAAYLRRRGYTGLTVSDSERRRAGGSLPAKWAAITFDDGFASVLRAGPVLAAAGIPATVFVVTGVTDSKETVSWPFLDQVTSGDPDDMRPLSWDELRSLSGQGWEIGSHTVTHRYLGALDDDELVRELEISRKTIEAEVGACVSLAYPYGLTDARVMRAARTAGYTAACTLAPTYDRDEPLARARTGVSPADGSWRFGLKSSPRITALRCTGSGRLVQRIRLLVKDGALPDHRRLLAEFSSEARSQVDQAGGRERMTTR